jgi:photosystem II stability/assembly factor-like uncharacterized protein
VSDPSELFDVAMFDNTEGMAVGAAGVVLRTSDGGVSWPQVAGGRERFSMSGVDFVDTQSGVAVANDNSAVVPGFPEPQVYATSDGGATWTVTFTTFGGLSDVTFADATTVYAVGRGLASMDGGANIYRSVDGGMTWTTFFSQCCPPCSGGCIPGLSGVDFVGPNTGVAVGAFGGVLEIQGGVVTWVTVPTVENLTGVSVPSSQTAYAVGNNGVILKGNLVTSTWVQLASGTSLPLYDVCFTDDLTGTVVGAGGTILRTNDGGTTWTAQTGGTIGNLVSVSFLDGPNGIIGGGTTLLKTLNGGMTWVSGETPSALADVVYVDPANVSAVGGDENIISRRDIPVPVFFQDFAAWVRPHAVELRWAVYADEAIQGFRMYRRSDNTAEIVVSDGLIVPRERTFVDHDVARGAAYTYTMGAVHENGSETRSQPIRVDVPNAQTTLFQNHPNPFNPTTRIHFSLSTSVHVTLSVFDISGRRVATLVNRVLPGGENEVLWNGKNDAGDEVATGIYFYELRTSETVLTRKMTLLK